SRVAELGERSIYLLVGGKAAFGRRLQTAVNPGQFRLARFIVAVAEVFLDIARDLGKLVLRLSGPAFDAFEDFSELFGFHGGSIARIGIGGIRCAMLFLYDERHHRTRAQERWDELRRKLSRCAGLHLGRRYIRAGGGECRRSARRTLCADASRRRGDPRAAQLRTAQTRSGFRGRQRRRHRDDGDAAREDSGGGVEFERFRDGYPSRSPIKCTVTVIRNSISITSP